MRVPAILATLALVAWAVPSHAAPAEAPADGATVGFDLRSSGGAPDGSFWQVTEARLELTLADGAWTGTCTGTTTVTMDGADSTETFVREAALAPPAVDVRLRRGDQLDPEVTAAAPEGCRHDLGPLVVAGRAKDGSRTMVATEPADASAYQDALLAWDPHSGAVRSWSFAGRSASLEGRLVP